MEGSSEVGGRAGGRRRRVSEAAESQRDALAPKALSVGGRGNFCCAQSQLVPCQCGRPDVWAEDALEEAKGAGDVGGIRILKVRRDRGTEGPRAAPGRAAFSQAQERGGPGRGARPDRSRPSLPAGFALCPAARPKAEGAGRREVTISRFRDLPRLSAGLGTGPEAWLRPWLWHFLAEGPEWLRISAPHFPHL